MKIASNLEARFRFTVKHKHTRLGEYTDLFLLVCYQSRGGNKYSSLLRPVLWWENKCKCNLSLSWKAVCWLYFISSQRVNGLLLFTCICSCPRHCLLVYPFFEVAYPMHFSSAFVAYLMKYVT